MNVFEPGSSGIGIYRSANCATPLPWVLFLNQLFLELEQSEVHHQHISFTKSIIKFMLNCCYRLFIFLYTRLLYDCLRFRQMLSEQFHLPTYLPTYLYLVLQKLYPSKQVGDVTKASTYFFFLGSTKLFVRLFQAFALFFAPKIPGFEPNFAS